MVMRETNMNKINTKIKHLNAYLKKNHNLSLARAIGQSDKSMEKIYEGGAVPFWVINKIASFFMFDKKILKDDKLKLPKDKDLVCDKELIDALEEDKDSEWKLLKNKHELSRNYRMLSHGKRVSLWLSLAIVCVPIMAFAIGCLTWISIDRVNTLDKYKHAEELSEYEKTIQEAALSREGLTYVTVNTGSEIEKITDISHSSNSYVARLSTFFDFDQMEFHKMFYRFDEGKEFNADDFYTTEDLLADNYTPSDDGTNDVYLEYGDNIPDIIQFNFEAGAHPSDESNKPVSLSTLYKNRERAAFPGEQQSNNFPDNNSEFFVGNGTFVPDSIEIREKGRAYKAEDGSFRFFQKIHFDAKIEKTFDSPRYPLDSVQFHIYIQPNRSSDYVRYNLVDKVSINGETVAFNGFSSSFSMTNGYRRIHSSGDIRDLTTRILYYAVNEENALKNEDPSNWVIKSELEIVVRANKSGMSSFIQAFINIFAVGIWMIIAFFNQSYNKQDSIGMIGTGLFAAISSILVGVSMISDANIFSLITMINIFTLALILIMAYESIAAKRASVKENKAAMAYRSIKLRVIFYVLIISSLMMFVALPLTAYIFTI